MPTIKRRGRRRHSKANTTPDMNRLAKHLSFPGIDSRIWYAQATVLSEVPTVTEEGVFIDVYLMPYGIEETARLAGFYAGQGVGAYFPPAQDDEVSVFAPEGDPSAGLIAFPRLWSPSDMPPQEAIDHPSDSVIRIAPGKSLRVLVSDVGELVLACDATGAVRLGDESATDSAVLGDSYRGAEDGLFAATSALLSAVGGFIAAGPVHFLSPAQADAVAVALTAYGTAKTLFDSAASTYLSKKVKVSP